MVTLNKTVTIAGVSVIEDSGKKIQVAYMNANIPANGNANISRVIQDKQMFELYKSEVLKDFAEFDDYIYNLIPEVSGEVKEMD